MLFWLTLPRVLVLDFKEFRTDRCFVIWWLWMMPEDQELYHLFAFPLECNFSGAKFYLDLITQIQQGRNCGKKHL
jgi:hypothetical protein